MALANSNSSLLDELISLATKNYDKNTTRFKKLKAHAEARLKDSSWGRTDQFAVDKQLLGLEEKFRVLNKDDFADALQSRVAELRQNGIYWTPEILSLLLQVSDRPASLSRLPDINTWRPSIDDERLTWSELDASGSAYDQENIWDDIDFAAESSDDDFSSASSEVSIPRIVPQSSKIQKDEFLVPEALFSSGEDDDLIATIRSGHFWEYDSTAVREFRESHTRFITELQAVREVVFMLQGLPTSLFWHVDESVEIDRRFSLRHSSEHAFQHILRYFASVGTKLGSLRRFVQTQQDVIFLQTFLRGVEDCLIAFDAFLTDIQLDYLSPSQPTTVSLLKLVEDIEKESRVLIHLSQLVTQLNKIAVDESYKCLEILYELVCTNQATGNDHEFNKLAKIFLACFQAYTRPMQSWMESGDLDAAQDNFFILSTGQDDDLRNLWHGWYSLNESSGELKAPAFIRQAAHKIFTAGKSMVFLRNMHLSPQTFDALKDNPLSFDDILSHDASAGLIPFSSRLDAAFNTQIDRYHDFASTLLREQLDQRCGLWMTLTAMEYIYLCSDISISSSIDSRIFDLIDKGRGVWNDRYLLTELVQSTYSDVPYVDPSRLLVRSTKGPYRDIENRNRTVKILKALSVDFILPWPVANIITRNAITIYQRVFTLLMQIRRAKYILERQRLRREKSSGEDVDLDFNEEGDGLGYLLRISLLWFANVLYSHLTEFVISMGTATMRKDLVAAKDVDSMITVHQNYMTSLEEQCLLSKNLGPIYQAVISILDLSIHFADIQAARYGGDNQFDQTSRSFGSTGGGADAGEKLASERRRRQRRRRRRQRQRQRELQQQLEISTLGIDEDESSDSDGDYDDEDDDENNDDNNESTFLDEGNSTSISFLDSPYTQRLRDARTQFDRSLSFVIAGLRGVGRANGQQSWEVLADRLEWRKKSLG